MYQTEEKKNYCPRYRNMMDAIIILVNIGEIPSIKTNLSPFVQSKENSWKALHYNLPNFMLCFFNSHLSYPMTTYLNTHAFTNNYYHVTAIY